MLFQVANDIHIFCVAISRGPRCVQTSLTRGDPKDKERKEAETEREEAEGDRKPKASGQCQSGPEKPCVCGGALTATRRLRGEYRVSRMLSGVYSVTLGHRNCWGDANKSVTNLSHYLLDSL